MSRPTAHRRFALCLVGGLVALAPYAAAEEKPIQDADVAAWVAKRVEDWQPRATERRFDEIGWVKDIRTAERLAREHQRPVFLFTHDGRMAVGRCWGGACAIRASSLSNAKVISLINRYFVPVYVSNEDYVKNGSAPAEEKAERNRIYREALQAKLSAGTVHVYILAPDGHCIDSQHVATASKVEELTAMLERTVARLKTPEGQPLAKPCTQSVPVRRDAGDLVIHVTARYLQRQGGEDVVPPVRLGETRAGGWAGYPGEDWVSYSRAEVKKLLPAGPAAAGTRWDIDRETAARLLHHFYPPTENNDVRTNAIDELTLKASILSVANGVVRARLDGRLKMKHPFYHKPDDKVVETTLVGFVDFELATQTVRAFQLVTRGATYGSHAFGAAARPAP